jgi:hypothetical protein
MDAEKRQPVRLWDLSWRQSLIFLRYRIFGWHWRTPIQRPRASWAQLLVALGITEVKELILVPQDSDTIPSSLDNPLQRVKLRDLGRIAFILGFQTVVLDVPNRVFAAYSPIASITTEEVNVIGKVLRFEGDILELHAMIGRCHSAWIIRASPLVVGQGSFGMYLANGLFWPLALLNNCMVNGTSSNAYDKLERTVILQSRQSFSAGPILRESYLLKDMFMQRLQAKTSEKRPHASTLVSTLRSAHYPGFRSAYANSTSRTGGQV